MWGRCGWAPLTRLTKEGVDPRPRVLFVCVHNLARSQLPEESLRPIAGDRFFIESAGLTAGTLNPHVVALLLEENCPVFPGPVRRPSWPFADPAGFVGIPEEGRTHVILFAKEFS